jgi:hypothetical protein
MRKDNVGKRARGEDQAEILLGHQRAEGVLGDTKVVASHVEKRVRHPQRKPVDEPPDQEPSAVFERVIPEIEAHHDGQNQTHRAEVHRPGASQAGRMGQKQS